jgi:3-phytase
MRIKIPALIIISIAAAGCDNHPDMPLQPITVTDRVTYDSDDPAIWINEADPSESLVVGTDKDTDGALYVFDLDGNVLTSLTVDGLNRPNNVDIEYGLIVDGTPTDIAVVTERQSNRLRVYSMPDLLPLDGGAGIPVFVGEADRDCMGIALYKRPSDGEIFAIVSRTYGPSGTYLWEYLLDGVSGTVTGTDVRHFGAFSGIKEIESIAVDDSLGYVYYSDEMAGVRKYLADPDAPNAEDELAFFGTGDFERDLEGISIYELDETTGYILVSDQQANGFNIYPREGLASEPHSHPLLKAVFLSTEESDGSDVTSITLSTRFPGGFFVAMSTDKTFQYYSWEQIALAPGERLAIRP